jgi:hypothetical protein
LNDASAHSLFLAGVAAGATAAFSPTEKI